MSSPEISVYGEAKGEYTRQLCVFLVPTLETYFLDLLTQAREEAPSSNKILWQFQSLLQAIPEWNQDKVLRETEKLQKDCQCDYLEELLTAVFIAHTKVLSAIRLSTKQKKLQITIPKLDHFLHRLLSECARSLWTNAFLFADTNSIEKQKNLRQVSGLLQEAVLQAIRGLLPVKSILREYLHEEESDEEEDIQKQEIPVKHEDEASSAAPAVASTEEKEAEVEAKQAETEAVEAPQEAETVEAKQEAEPETVEAKQEVSKEEQSEAPVAEEAKSEEASQQQPIINIETKPTVSFTQEHVFFDSSNLEANQIQDTPFAEAELKEYEDDEEFEDEEEIDSIQITDEVLPMEAEELSL